MKLDKLITLLRDLTPQQKLELLNSELKKEKTKKGKEQILLIIETAKIEQEDIEDKLRELSLKKQSKEEQPLENIVQKEAPPEEEQNSQKQVSIQRLYGIEEKKPQNIYGREELKFNLEDKQKTEYKLASEDRFTREREQSFISEEERLKRERKKYETGTV